MHPVAVGAGVFAAVFGGALFGLRLRAALPEPHLSSDTKDVVKLAMGLVATMTALILGLLIASAKDSYDAQRNAVIQMSAKIAFLDRMLALYGPDAGDVRAALRTSVEREIASLWPNTAIQSATLDPKLSDGSLVGRAVEKLSPDDDEKRAIKAQAISLVADLGQMRWVLFEQAGRSISTPLLIVVGVWLAVIFASFGLFAPSNGTVIVALMVASLCVAGSIYLLLELDQPFGGLIRIPSAPMQLALQHLGE